MGRFELIRFSSRKTLAEAASRRWLERLKEAKRQDLTQYVALSGGRISIPFYQNLVSLTEMESFVWPAVHFFWADERCVPPEDAESNYRQAYESLFKPLAIPEEQIHRIHGELPPTESANLAQEEIMNCVTRQFNHQPILDLVFLGMGEDGHVASLFPEAPEEVVQSQAVYQPVVASKPPPQRITLGYPALSLAKEVWVLVSGEGKQDMLKQSTGAYGTTPLAKVIQSRENTLIWKDFA